MANKNISKGLDARLKVKAGVDKACDAVRPTLGAVGMTALIEFPGLDPIECDDGVTILKNLEFKDRHENMGLQMLRKAAVRTSSEGGDGTATTTVLTQGLVSAAFDEIGNDSSKIREVKERLDNGLKDVIAHLSLKKQDVKEEDIEKIANISSLDPEVSKLIAEIIKEVGVNGVVSVEKGKKLGYSKEVVKGARFPKGFISPYFINQKDRSEVILEDAYIVLVDRKVSTNEQIIGLLNSIGTGKSMLFIATDVDSVALGTLAANAANGIAQIACVQNPYSASRGRDFLADIAALTGATVISEEMGMLLKDAQVNLCGRAEKVIVTKDTTTIIGGHSKGEELNDRVKDLEAQTQNTTSEYERDMLEDRIAALTGGIGVIRVGAYTDTEFNAKKYKFDNAVNATQAALQEGILAGGGIALLEVSTLVEEKMFAKALPAPFRQMALNAGVNPEVAMYEMKKEADLDNGTWGHGFDFKEKKVRWMFAAGIVDPFKVVRLALESATAIASSVIGFETAVTQVDEPKKED